MARLLLPSFCTRRKRKRPHPLQSMPLLCVEYPAGTHASRASSQTSLKPSSAAHPYPQAPLSCAEYFQKNSIPLNPLQIHLRLHCRWPPQQSGPEALPRHVLYFLRAGVSHALPPARGVWGPDPGESAECAGEGSVWFLIFFVCVRACACLMCNACSDCTGAHSG
jgi:hypothetical protein